MIVVDLSGLVRSTLETRDSMQPESSAAGDNVPQWINSNESTAANAQPSTGSDTRKETKSSRTKKDFPWKLHIMLEDAEREENKEILSWSPEGLSFMVYQPDVFVKQIMPRYFNQTQFRSFQRMVS
jgi:hypothetical protein